MAIITIKWKSAKVLNFDVIQQPTFFWKYCCNTKIKNVVGHRVKQREPRVIKYKKLNKNSQNNRDFLVISFN